MEENDFTKANYRRSCILHTTTYATQKTEDILHRDLIIVRSVSAGRLPKRGLHIHKLLVRVVPTALPMPVASNSSARVSIAMDFSSGVQLNNPNAI